MPIETSVSFADTELEKFETSNSEASSTDPEMRRLVLEDMENDGKDLELSGASEVEPLSDAGLAMASKSLFEMELLLSNNDRVLTSAQAKLREAQVLFEANSNRRNFMTDAEHQARMQSYLPKLEASEDEVLNLLEQVDMQGRAIAEATSFSREPQLSSDDMAKANSFREFVKEDCETLPIAALQAKLQKVVAENDPVTAWLYVRYASQRMDAANQESATRRADGSYTPANVTPAMLAANTQCRELIKHLSLRLSDTRVPKVNAAAKELLQKSRDLSSEARSRRDKARVDQIKAQVQPNRGGSRTVTQRGSRYGGL